MKYKWIYECKECKENFKANGLVIWCPKCGTKNIVFKKLDK